jgi:hypothetical protein
MANNQQSPAWIPFVWQSSGELVDFAVSFPKAPKLDLLLIGAELYQAGNDHDVLVLHFKGRPDIKQNALISKDPIVFTFRSQKLTSTWHGHIDRIEQPNTVTGGNTNIICIGPSYFLKDTSQKVYKNVTADQVISRIATKHRMQAVTQRHPRVKNSIVQAGQSDWQLLRRLAKVTGFALRCENSSILFVSKDKLYTDKKNSAPYFYFVGEDDNTGTVTAELRMLGTCFAFKPIISDSSPDTGVRVDRVITGMHAKNGTVLTTTHKHKSNSKGNAGVVVPSKEYFDL